MPFILITGTSTSGKSSAAKELLKRGYEAYDTEHNGISAWYNKQTGERAAEFGEAPERSESWLVQHEWLISNEWLQEMAKKAKAKESLIFACGGTGRTSAITPYFDKIFWLKVNEELFAIACVTLVITITGRGRMNSLMQYVQMPQKLSTTKMQEPKLLTLLNL